MHAHTNTHSSDLTVSYSMNVRSTEFICTFLAGGWCIIQAYFSLLSLFYTQSHHYFILGYLLCCCTAPSKLKVFTALFFSAPILWKLACAPWLLHALILLALQFWIRDWQNIAEINYLQIAAPEHSNGVYGFTDGKEYMCIITADVAAP